MRKLRTVAAAMMVVAGSVVAGAADVPAATTWAPAAWATIHPAVQTFTQGSQCTANFVFTDSTAVYLGQAAHCSWLTMQAQRESNPDACQFNDLALIRLDPADVGRVNPSMPHWGGPAGLAPSASPLTSLVYSSGNSTLRRGLPLLMPKVGISLGDDAGGWSHSVVTLTPGIPGDSGSGFLDAQGRALGVLSTLQILPLPGTNGVGDLRLELDYMHAHTSMTAQLAVGTQTFNPNQLPLGP